jgi:hypothetical protein
MIAQMNLLANVGKKHLLIETGRMGIKNIVHLNVPSRTMTQKKKERKPI